EEMFPKAYALVLNTLLELLEEREGRSRVVALLRDAGARAVAGGAPAAGEEARVRTAVEVLRRLGGDVELERGESGWTIRGYGCPLSAVVSEHDSACQLAESLVAEITALP